MMSARFVLQAIPALCVLMTLAACGGGGGDGGDGGSGTSTPQIDLSSSSLTFTAQQYSSVPPASQTVTAQARNGEVFLSVGGYNADLDCNQTSRCTITVTPPAPMNSPAGTQNHTVNIRVCADQACQSGSNIKTIEITYIITPGAALSVSPSTPNLAVDIGVTPAPFPLSLTFSNGTPTSWSAAARYATGSQSGWLHLTPSANTLSLTFDALPAATFFASIDITYSGDGWTNTVAVPLSYTVRPAPVVDSVAPNIAVTNESLTVVVRGKAFDRLTQPVKFGGVDALNVTHISDTQLLVTPPPFATPGVYDVTVENPQGNITGRGRFVVVPPRNYAGVSLDVSGITDEAYKFPVYDAEREKVYFRRADGLHAGMFENGAWQFSRFNPIIQTGRVRYSADNLKVYFPTNARSVAEFDLDTGRITNTFADFADRDMDGFALTGDGRIFWYRDNNATVYDPVLQRSTEFQLGLGLSSENYSSADRETILVVDPSAAGKVSIVASAAAPAQPFLPIHRHSPHQIALSRHARRIIIGRDVYDRSGTLIGQLAFGSEPATITISADENRAYVVSQTIEATPRTALHVYDISGDGPTFFQIGSTVNFSPSAGPTAMPAITPDGRTLFIVGSERFIVHLLPR